MSSLFSALSIATGALDAEQGAMDATTDNVANATTPGYSRQGPALVESDPLVDRFGDLRTGSDPREVGQRARSDSAATHRSGNSTARAIEYIRFRHAAGASAIHRQQHDIPTQISNFFSSLSQLSTAPASVPLRQSVLTAAGNLATVFNDTAASFTQQRATAD